MFSSELSLLPCFVFLAMADSTSCQILPRLPRLYVTQRVWENVNRNPQEHKINHPLTSDYAAQTGQILKTFNPQTRRFLFSPTIQNTITNLNQNSNLQEVSVSDRTDSKSTHVPVNPRTGAVEYDFRSSGPRKICITFE